MLKLSLLEEIIEELNSEAQESIGIILPEGTAVPHKSTDHRIVFKSKRAFKETLKDLEMGFGEGYMRGEIEVEGDLEKVLIAGIRYINKMEREKGLKWKLFRIGSGILLNRIRERENIKKHYDLGNDFYKLWLDKSLTYSCAYFSPSHLNLEEAQRKKREVIYKKLQLKAGDKLLDIGCGWGSLIVESAELFDVKAVGITLSENQYHYVKEEIKKRGLEGKVEVHLMHYCDLPTLGEKFNKVVSVGMFEHVGVENYRLFFRIVEKVLEDEGLFLLHTIGKVHESSQSRWIRKYIFPGGYIPSLVEIISAFEGTDFSLIDIDDWRPHYYRTLKEWYKRFWKNAGRVWEMYGSVFLRMWNLYLLSSAVSFYVGSNHLFQILLSKGVRNDYPTLERIFSDNPIPKRETAFYEFSDKRIS